jgi:hypothetical protein
MPEVCPPNRTNCKRGDLAHRRQRIRRYATLLNLTTGRRRPPHFLPYRYQIAIQNAYAVVTRPPLTRAAHFKRLYRK